MTALIVRDLVKRFNSIDAVAGVSLVVAPGERRVIIGPNGAGKTTLFHCIAGAHLPTAGTIIHNGRNITWLSANARARQGLARTFQITNLFPSLTLTENVLLALTAVETMGVRRLFKSMHGDSLRLNRAARLLSDWGLVGHERQ